MTGASAGGGGFAGTLAHDSELDAEAARLRAFDAAEAHVNRLLPVLLLPRKRAALDFGCGAGAATVALARRFEHVVGVDRAASALSAARSNASQHRAGNAIFLKAGELDRLAAGFDLVHATGAFQRIPPEDGLRYLGKLASLLDEAGALAVELAYGPETQGPAARLLARVRDRFLLGPAARADFRYPLERVLAVLEAHGLPHLELELVRLGTAFLVARRRRADYNPL